MYEKEKKLIEAFKEIEKAIDNFDLHVWELKGDELYYAASVFMEESKDLRNAMVLAIAGESQLLMDRAYAIPGAGRLINCEVGSCTNCHDYVLSKPIEVDEDGNAEVDIHTCYRHVLDAIELLKNF